MVRGTQVTRARIMSDIGNVGSDDSDNEGFASEFITPRLLPTTPRTHTPPIITSSLLSQETEHLAAKVEDPFDFYRQEITSLTEQCLTLQTQQMIIQDEFLRFQARRDQENSSTLITPIAEEEEKDPTHSQENTRARTRASSFFIQDTHLTMHGVLVSALASETLLRCGLMIRLLMAWYVYQPTSYLLHTRAYTPIGARDTDRHRVQQTLARTLFLWPDHLLRACVTLEPFLCSISNDATSGACIVPREWFVRGHAVREFLTEQLDLTPITRATALLSWHGMHTPYMPRPRTTQVDSVDSVDLLRDTRMIARFQCRDGFLFTLDEDKDCADFVDTL